MSKTAKFDDIDLMLYVDGELDSETAARVSEFLAEDEDASTKVESLHQMDDVLASYLELAADDQDHRFDAMWSTIERRIGANGVAAEAATETANETAGQAARDIDEAASRAVKRRPKASVQERESGGIWAAINNWLEGYRGHILTGAAAVAAAALLIIAVKSTQTVVMTPQPGPTPVNNPVEPDVKPAIVELAPPQIEQLEVTDGSGTVFVMPSEGEDDVAATVIFVDMDEVMNDSEGPL